MSADEVARRQLQERLLDDVELPSEAAREAMFERTFASPPDAGQDLLPPDGFFDPAADDLVHGVSEADGDSGADDPFTDDGVAEQGEEHGALDLDPDAAYPATAALDHADDGDHGDHRNVGSTDHPATDW